MKKISAFLLATIAALFIPLSAYADVAGPLYGPAALLSNSRFVEVAIILTVAIIVFVSVIIRRTVKKRKNSKSNKEENNDNNPEEL